MVYIKCMCVCRVRFLIVMLSDFKLKKKKVLKLGQVGIPEIGTGEKDFEVTY